MNIAGKLATLQQLCNLPIRWAATETLVVAPALGPSWLMQKFSRALIHSWMCSVAWWRQRDGSLLIHMQLGNVNKTGAAGSYQSLYLSYLRRLLPPFVLPRRPHIRFSAG